MLRGQLAASCCKAIQWCSPVCSHNLLQKKYCGTWSIFGASSNYELLNKFYVEQAIRAWLVLEGVNRVQEDHCVDFDCLECSRPAPASRKSPKINLNQVIIEICKRSFVMSVLQCARNHHGPWPWPRKWPRKWKASLAFWFCILHALAEENHDEHNHPGARPNRKTTM